MLLVSSFQLYLLLQPEDPVLPPEEWTLIAVGQPDEGCEGWELAAEVYTGIRDGVFFIRAVWNESRQHLQSSYIGIYGSGDTLSGSEGTALMNVSYHERRYVYVQMRTPLNEYEVVVAQFPHIVSEFLHLYNLQRVYKAGDNYTAILGVVPNTETPGPLEPVEDFEIVSVEAGFRASSRNDFYLSGSLPAATSHPIVDGFSEDWEALTKLEILYNNTPPSAPMALQSFSLSLYDECLSLMFALGGNYSTAFQRFPQANLYSLSQASFYASSSPSRESYSVYLHADRLEGQLDITGSIRHSWTEDGVIHSERLQILNSLFAANDPFEVILYRAAWQDLTGIGADRIHISPDVQFAYQWILTLVPS